MFYYYYYYYYYYYPLSCYEPQGKLTGYIFKDKFWMNKEKFTRVGFEPGDLRIDVPALYQLS